MITLGAAVVARVMPSDTSIAIKTSANDVGALAKAKVTFLKAEVRQIRSNTMAGRSVRAGLALSILHEVILDARRAICVALARGVLLAEFKVARCTILLIVNVGIKSIGTWQARGTCNWAVEPHAA